MNINKVSNNIGYCGLICNLCHLFGTCDGCKSSKNCCAKHLLEGECYQYNCCIKKNINGCWECIDFPCDKDMFSNSHDIRICAFVRCAKEEGIEKLIEYIVLNQKRGIKYAYQKDYDGLSSKKEVFKLLKFGKK